VWSIVSSITQLQSAQGVSAGRASLALLLLPGLAIAAAIILVLWFYGSGGTGP
jgi:hypothetical protein